MQESFSVTSSSPSYNPVPAKQPPPAAVSPPASLVLTVTLLLVFFLGFFCVLLCRCIVETIFQGWNPNHDLNSGNPDSSDPNEHNNLGLDPSLVQTFPTFTYASVKDFRREKYGLECAICLSEFTGEDFLRLLTVCCHVFHQECIDLWLQSHKTCPVCRQDLDLPKETLLEKVALTSSNNTPSRHTSNPSEHSITIEGNEEVNNDDMKKGIFSRSNSTGHDPSAMFEKKDRYTLRLVDNVRMIISPRRGHFAAESCITFGEFSSPSPSPSPAATNREVSASSAPNLQKQ